ncbi:MAG: hypothetical protein KDA85_18275 [Planctomycetaceae bacterium]|nr:hypothetical protein [Planctomycetaceae bacterium]
MEQTALSQPEQSGFFERRRSTGDAEHRGLERRQFRDGDYNGRPEVAELAAAIDDYKIAHRRRFITFEELYDVISSMGYHR